MADGAASGADVRGWRRLGLELAFDPGAPPGVTEVGRAQLADALAHLDAAQLLRMYPREADGRLPLREVVLLAPVHVMPAPRPPKQVWLVATGPAKRSSPQVVTLALQPEFARNAEHLWDEARWLWDARAASTPEAVRWGTTRLPIDELARGGPPDTLAFGADGDARAAHAIRLVRAGRWRDALAACGVTHALDPLPYKQCNHGGGIAPEVWDAALDAHLTALAPWRLASAAAAPNMAAHGHRLFNLPGQTTSRKYCVALRRAGGAPHLVVACTGSNARLPVHLWSWPPDLALALRGGGGPGGIAPAGSAVATAGAREDDLLAQIAANPADDDARRVYADFLIERGDARGEMITLQLAPPTKQGNARIRALQRIHARAWLGALGALVDVKLLRFERGFLARCALGGATTPFDAWATALEPRARIELASVRELTLAAAFPVELARELLAVPPLALARLTLDAVALAPAVSSSVPEVEVLVTSAVDTLVAWPMLQRIPTATLQLTADPVVLPGLLRGLLCRLGELGPGATRLVLASRDDVRLEARRAGREWTVAIEAKLGTGSRRISYTLPDALAACPVGLLGRVEVRCDLTTGELARLQAECIARGRAREVVVHPRAPRQPGRGMPSSRDG